MHFATLRYCDIDEVYGLSVTHDCRLFYYVNKVDRECEIEIVHDCVNEYTNVFL